MSEKATVFWLRQIDDHGNLLAVLPAPDADHMGHSPALDEILKSHPNRPDWVRKDFNGNLELTSAGRSTLAGLVAALKEVG